MRDGAQRAMPEIGGVSLEQIAREHGTPCYVYDAARILEHAEHIDAALDYRPRRMLYSAKANPAVAIAALMREAGQGLDACSPGDLRLAALAGFAPGEISYTGFGASEADLALAAQGAGTVIVDNLGELDMVGAHGLMDGVGLRVNPAIRAGFHDHVMAGAPEAKFGLDASQLREAKALARSWNIRITGLHAHLGSDLLEVVSHVKLLRALVEMAQDYEDVSWLNLGGGFGTPRRAGELVYDWAPLGREAQATLRGGRARALELRLEPGGYALMDAGFLLARAVEVRAPSAGRPPTIVLDASTNHLVSVLLYGAHHPVWAISDRAQQPLTYRLAGNLMQAGDVLAERVELSPVQEGDLLLIGHVGAYASCRATTFNERPRPAEVLVRDGVAKTIRRAETVDELFARDRCV